MAGAARPGGAAPHLLPLEHMQQSCLGGQAQDLSMAAKAGAASYSYDVRRLGPALYQRGRGAKQKRRRTMTGTFSRGAAILLTASFGLAATACAADRSENVRPAGVVVRDVGQAKLILPAPEARAEQPYAMTGRGADEWQQKGHWVDAGQSRVYVPAAR
jgi:hypothetical protein